MKIDERKLRTLPEMKLPEDERKRVAAEFEDNWYTDNGGQVWTIGYFEGRPCKVNVTEDWNLRCDRAYAEGREAAGRLDVRVKDALCPYPIGQAFRTSWFTGLFDVQYSDKYCYAEKSARDHNRISA